MPRSNMENKLVRAMDVDLRILPALVVDIVEHGALLVLFVGWLEADDLRFVQEFAVKTQDFFVLCILKFTCWSHGCRE